jgi:hypothetical protein
VGNLVQSYIDISWRECTETEFEKETFNKFKQEKEIIDEKRQRASFGVTCNEGQSLKP